MGFSSKEFKYYFATDLSKLREHERLFASEDVLISLAFMLRSSEESKSVLKRIRGDIMLDSGAFTNVKKPGTVSFDQWADFVKANAGQFKEFIQFDDCCSRARTIAFYEKSKGMGLNSLFVDHLNLPPRPPYLEKVWKESGKLCMAGIARRVAPGSVSTGKSFIWPRFEANMRIADEVDTHVHLLAIGALKKFLPYLHRIHSVDSTKWGKAAAYGWCMSFGKDEVEGIEIPTLVIRSAPHQRIAARPLSPEELKRFRGIIAANGWQKLGLGSQLRAVNIAESKKYIAALKAFDPTQLIKALAEKNKRADFIRKALMDEDGYVNKQDPDADVLDPSSDDVGWTHLMLREKVLRADWPMWSNEETEKAITADNLAGGGKLPPASFPGSGLTDEYGKGPVPADFQAEKAKEAKEAKEKQENADVTVASVSELKNEHDRMHSLWRYREEGVEEGEVDLAKVVRRHAEVADAMFERGFAHPPPPTDGLDGDSAGFEAYAAQQPADHNVDPRLPGEAKPFVAKLERVEVSKPFPNEHAARQRPPSDFDPSTFRRTAPSGELQGGFGAKGLAFIVGRLLSTGKFAIQTVRFDRKRYTPAEAKAWLKEHDFRDVGFEEATEKRQPFGTSGRRIQQRKRDAFPVLCEACKAEPAGFDLWITEQIDNAQSLCLSCLDWASKHEQVDIQVDILKIDAEKRVILGIALEPDEVDAQNDTITPEVIERAAHNFLANFGKVGGTRLGLMHKQFGDIGLDLVRSWIALEDSTINGKRVKKGTWLAAVRAQENAKGEAIWQRAKKGELNGFSIGGVAAID